MLTVCNEQQQRQRRSRGDVTSTRNLHDKNLHYMHTNTPT